MCVCVCVVGVDVCVFVRAYLYKAGVSRPKVEEDDVDMFA